MREAALSGEAADVCDEDVDTWKERLPDLCKGHEPENIYSTRMKLVYFSQHYPPAHSSHERMLAGVESSHRKG